MSFPYPENKILTALVLVLLLAGSAQAQQQGNIAGNNTLVSNQTSHFIAKPQSAVKISYRSDRKISLTWMAFRGEVSHYVLERSYDGRTFSEAGVFFTSGIQEEPQYQFVDQLRRAYAGPLFYRLRVVGLDGSEMYTLPTMSTPESNRQ